MLHNHIQESGLSTTSKLFEEAVSYLCRMYGKGIKVYHQRFANSSKFDGEISPSTFRHSLHCSRGVGVSVKYFTMYAAFAYRNNPASRLSLVAHAASFGVSARDAVRIVKMFLDPQFLSDLRAALVRQNITPALVSFKEYNRVMKLGGQLVTDLRESVAIHVNRKLAWVAHQHSINVRELHSEITSELLEVFYAALPTTRTDQHMHGYLCSALHSRIANLQNKHGSMKRARTVRFTEHGEEKFVQLETNITRLNKASDGDEFGLDDIGTGAENPELHNYEFSRSINSLLRGAKRGTRRYALYCVLLGREVANFTEYLKRKRILRNSARKVSDWLKTKTPEYLSKVFGDWLGVHPESVKRSMDTVAASLL